MYRIYENQLQLDLHKSVIFYCFLIINFALVLLSLLLLPVNLAIKLVVVIFMLYACLRHVSQRRDIVSIKWHRGNSWFIFLTTGEKVDASLLDTSFVSHAFCVLNFELKTGRQFSYTIFPDSVNRNQLRQLRVRMKIEHKRLFSQ